MGTSEGPRVAVKAIKALNKRPIQSQLKGTKEFNLQRRPGTKDVIFFFLKPFLNLRHFLRSVVAAAAEQRLPTEKLRVHIPVMFAVVS